MADPQPVVPAAPDLSTVEKVRAFLGKRLANASEDLRGFATAFLTYLEIREKAFARLRAQIGEPVRIPEGKDKGKIIPIRVLLDALATRVTQIELHLAGEGGEEKGGATTSGGGDAEERDQTPFPTGVSPGVGGGYSGPLPDEDEPQKSKAK